MQDSFKARRKLTVGKQSFDYYALDALGQYPVRRLPYSLKILLENLLRHEDGRTVTRDDIIALASADPRKLPQREIASFLRPAGRCLLRQLGQHRHDCPGQHCCRSGRERRRLHLVPLQRIRLGRRDVAGPPTPVAAEPRVRKR